MTTKECTKCKKEKLLREFSNAPSYDSNDGYAYWCKKCTNEFSAINYRKNVEKKKWGACKECGRGLSHTAKITGLCLACYNKTRKGKDSPCFKTGIRIDQKGYRSILNHDHPFAPKSGYVPEHRLVMEKVLGRYLKPNEKVHHINGMRGDNRPENLMLMRSTKVHLTEYKCSKCGFKFGHK